MTDDEFLSGLRDDWRTGSVAPQALARQYGRYRRIRRLATLGTFAGAAVFAAAFALLAAMALRQADALFTIGAVTFALAAPFVIGECADIVKAVRTARDQTPFGLLLQARDRQTTVRAFLRSMRRSALVLAAASLAAALAAAGGYAEAVIALPLALLWSATAAGLWWWQAHRGRRLTRETENLDALLREFDGIDG